MRAPIVAPLGAQQSGVHLFLRKGCLSPAKIADQFGPMRHRFQRPEPHHSRQGRGIETRPIHRARLLFHHPPATLSLATAIQIMMEIGCIGVALVPICLLFSLRKPELLKEAEGITVPTGNIKIASDGTMIELSKETHEVMDFVAPRRRVAHDFDLDPVEAGNLIRGKTPEIEPVRRVGFGHGQVWQFNFRSAAFTSIDQKTLPHASFNCSGDW